MAAVEEAPGEDEGRAAWAAFLRAHATAVHRIERLLDDAGTLPLSWYDVLLELSAAPRHRLRMQELSNRVVLSRSRVSRVVDAMAGRGLVCREPDPTDRRAAFAVLTAAGRQSLRASAPTYLRGIAEHFTAHLTADEVAVLRTALEKVRAANEGTVGDPHGPG